MAEEDKIEGIESRLDELEDLQLTNKIEIMEIKSIVSALQESIAKGEPIEPHTTEIVGEVPKNIMQVLDGLHQALSAVENRMRKMEDEMAKSKGKPIPKRKEKKEALPEKPSKTVEKPDKEEKEEPSGIDDKLDEIKNILGG